MHSREKGSIPEGRHVSAAIFILCIALVFALIAPVSAYVVPDGTIDPIDIPKWENQIAGPPPVFVPNGGDHYTITAKRITQQILPPSMNKMTPVFAYGGKAKDAITGKEFPKPIWNSPAPSFEVKRGDAIQVKWINAITVPHLFPVDPTLHWASPDPDCMLMDMAGPFPLYPPGFTGKNNKFGCNAQSNVPIVTHVHGLEVQSDSDGNPDAWFTANGIHGPAYSGGPKKANYAVFDYPNDQPATTLWYHDHALGVTRLNPTAGLAGFYLLRDPKDKVAPLLPSGKYEVPLAIQDRIFNEDGSLWFTQVGDNPDVHPYWDPEFFGNTIMVNGLVWPNMDVDQGQYRFRLLDGSNARFYTLSFDNGGEPLPFTVIGTEGGYLKAPVILTDLTIAPGERWDVLVDFSALDPGTTVLMTNTANAPFPDGDPEMNADPATTGQIIQFTVQDHQGFSPKTLPATLNPTLKGTSWPTLPAPTKERSLVLYEVMGANGPLEVLLDGQKWAAPVSELPVLGSTEEWTIIDLTGDTHPIHTHLAQFQLVNRQLFDSDAYTADWITANDNLMPPFPLDHPTVHLDATQYLIGDPIPPPANEIAWKDTIQMNPGEVTRIRLRFSPIDGSKNYPFDATEGPGYVWHCHIIDHEDNEMMRPFVVIEKPGAIKVTSDPKGATVTLDGIVKGVTPLKIKDVAPGKHTVVISMDNFYPKQRVVKVESGETTRIDVRLRPVKNGHTLNKGEIDTITDTEVSVVAGTDA
jgi:FtsP/CotA-like multicopper oxidase with cupredoxin domain